MQLKAIRKTVPTYTAHVYCGSRHGYGTTVAEEHELYDFVQQYVNDVGLGVTVTKTMFLYTHGNEPGWVVGLINYPRFPKEPEEIRKTALSLAEILMVKMRQVRVSVVFPDETVMLQDDEEA